MKNNLHKELKKLPQQTMNFPWGRAQVRQEEGCLPQGTMYFPQGKAQVPYDTYVSIYFCNHNHLMFIFI